MRDQFPQRAFCIKKLTFRTTDCGVERGRVPFERILISHKKATQLMNCDGDQLKLYMPLCRMWEALWLGGLHESSHEAEAPWGKQDG